MTQFQKFLKDESGATAIEYGLIAALIAVGIITGATAVGDQVNNQFTDVAEVIGNSETGSNENSSSQIAESK